MSQQDFETMQKTSSGWQSRYHEANTDIVISVSDHSWQTSKDMCSGIRQTMSNTATRL